MSSPGTKSPCRTGLVNVRLLGQFDRTDVTGEPANLDPHLPKLPKSRQRCPTAQWLLLRVLGRFLRTAHFVRCREDHGRR